MSVADLRSKKQPPRRSDSGRSLRARALAALARREYSRRELEAKLTAFAEDPAEIPALLDDFEQRGWLSESRVVEQVVATRRRRFGMRRIEQELREKGISDEAIEHARDEMKAGELDSARAIWQRKFGTAPADARERARQMRFLQGRGFGSDTIRRLLSDADD